MRPRKKRQGPHLTVSERNHIRDGVSPRESDVVCEYTPTDCEGWEFDLRGRKEEVTIIRPFIQPFLSDALLGQVGVASWSDCWSASVGSLRRSGAAVPLRAPALMAESLRYLFIWAQPLIGGNSFQPFGPFGHHPKTTAHRPKPPVYLLLHPSSSPLWTRTLELPRTSGTVVIFVIFF